VCHICGCTSGQACLLADEVGVCGWVDETQTLCTNPKCLRAARDGR